METVKVSTTNYSAFISDYKQIEIPEFQRPYRWNQKKIDDLLSDLETFFRDGNSEGLDYYMGSLLLCRKSEGENYQIIDGQQRLTTLNLIYYVLNKKLEEGQNLEYSNHLSFYHLKENKAYLQSKLELLKQLDKHNFWDKLVFTVVITQSEDQAFAFFDSQNNRGVSLATEDYLKAYHLREVPSEELQSKLATEWEKAAIKAQCAENVEQGLSYLFHEILYRSREWKGQKTIQPANKEKLLENFKKKTLKTDGQGYPLYYGRNNMRYASVEILEGENRMVEVSTKSQVRVFFSLRQPIYKGVNFFEFTQRYHDVLHKLFQDDESLTSESLMRARAFYDAIYKKKMSAYLRGYMQLCLVMYYDNFGVELIDKAIQYFDYFIGSIRIQKFYVRQESVKNSLIHSSNNLLDVIAHAYLPSEVFDFIKSEESISKIYSEEKLDNPKSVRGEYKKQLLIYYLDINDIKLESLNERFQWIR